LGIGSGDKAQTQDTVTAFALGQAIAKEGWVLLSGARNGGVMEAVNEGAKNHDPLDSQSASYRAKIKSSFGLCRRRDRHGDGQREEQHQHSVGDVVIACGYGGQVPRPRSPSH
jgi:hypothetical protein